MRIRLDGKDSAKTSCQRNTSEFWTFLIICRVDRTIEQEVSCYDDNRKHLYMHRDKDSLILWLL